MCVCVRVWSVGECLSCSYVCLCRQCAEGGMCVCVCVCVCGLSAGECVCCLYECVSGESADTGESWMSHGSCQ